MDSNSSPHEKLRHLEQLVVTLRSQLAQLSEKTDDDKSSSARKGSSSRAGGVPETPTDLSGSAVHSPAGALVGDFRFVDAANWEAVLDDVSREGAFPHHFTAGDGWPELLTPNFLLARSPTLPES